jgi:DGQHR domain-containing protein
MTTDSRSYFGCKIIQRDDSNTPSMFVFCATAKDIRKWVGIRRVSESAKGTQRNFRKTRMKALSRFLAANPINVVPNNILIAFEPQKAVFSSVDIEIDGDTHNNCADKIEWGFLNFSFELDQPEENRPALIVDGQHRLYGISGFESEDLPLLVVTLIDVTPEEQAFQFIVINNKAVRVQTDNVKSILANIDEDNLQDRLLSVGIPYGNVSPILKNINDRDDSPFQNLLDWDYNRTGNKIVPLTAIEQSMRHIRVMFTFLEDDEDSLVEIFLNIWQAVKLTYPSLWGQENNFMKKVNINALNEFISDRLIKAWEFGLIEDIFDTTSVRRQVYDILKQIPSEFWEQKWSIIIQDNANVRKLIIEDMEKQIQNYKLGKQWFEGLQLPIRND